CGGRDAKSCSCARATAHSDEAIEKAFAAQDEAAQEREYQRQRKRAEREKKKLNEIKNRVPDAPVENTKETTEDPEASAEAMKAKFAADEKTGETCGNPIIVEFDEDGLQANIAAAEAALAEGPIDIARALAAIKRDLDAVAVCEAELARLEVCASKSLGTLFDLLAVGDPYGDPWAFAEKNLSRTTSQLQRFIEPVPPQ